MDPALIAGSGLLAQLELPQVAAKFPPDFHEAYWFIGFDDSSGIGWYFYLLADTADLTLRHERAYVFLPNGTVLAAEGQGRRSREGVAAGDGFACRCEIPFFRWELRYAANMQRLTGSDILSGAAGPEPASVELALRVDAATPAWNVEGDWGEPPPSLRYHQLCRVAGELSVDVRRVPLGGTCFRSHSRRLRELAGFTGHSLSNALFPSGRAFGIMRFLDAEARPSRGRGFVFQDGRLFDADVRVTPILEKPVVSGEAIRVELDGDFGQAIITGETVTCAFKSYARGERRLGVHLDMAPGFLLGSGVVQYRWDGESAGGIIERATTLGRVGTRA